MLFLIRYQTVVLFISERIQIIDVDIIMNGMWGIEMSSLSICSCMVIFLLIYLVVSSIISLVLFYANH